jgi:hypothetical protein
MPRALFVGCSFLCDLYCDNQNIKVIHMPGVGNQLIAATVLHELAHDHYDQVYVTWTGINRMDIPVGLDLHKTLGQSYEYCRQLGQTVWYSSGGIRASGSSDLCPGEIRKIFHSLYVGAGPRYFTDLTLSSIITVQSLLTSKNIPSRMSFIYDTTTTCHELAWLTPVLGVMDTQSDLYNLVDWSQVQTKNTPYEWCKSRNLIKDDGFHPTREGMCQWVWENFNLDIASLLDHCE